MIFVVDHAEPIARTHGKIARREYRRTPLLPPLLCFSSLRFPALPFPSPLSQPPAATPATSRGHCEQIDRMVQRVGSRGGASPHMFGGWVAVDRAAPTAAIAAHIAVERHIVGGDDEGDEGLVVTGSTSMGCTAHTHVWIDSMVSTYPMYESLCRICTVVSSFPVVCFTSSV